jgi:pimeloyl-ACP methyl ester carboxylesterase
VTDPRPLADAPDLDFPLEYEDKDEDVDVDEEGHDFPLQNVSIHGHDVGFRRGGSGSGPALLFLHGIAGSSLTWIQVMSRLQDDFTVLAPDFVGHGHSAKPPGDYSLGNLASWTRDLLDVLEIERVTLVGQSYGGGVALQFAYQFPERIERLVLVDSGGLGQDVSWILRLFTLPGADVVMPLLFPSFVRNLGDRVVRLARSVGMENASVLESWRAYRSLIDPETRRAFVRTTRSVIEPGGQAVGANERLYLTERIPMLIVWGEHDRIIPVSHAYATHEVLPHARLEIIPGAGHFPHSEDPEKLSKLVRDFVATTEPYAHSPVEARDRLRRGPTGTGGHTIPTPAKTTTGPKGECGSRVG